jgi:hypothetical protein
MTKELSVIIAALDTYEEVKELHRCVENQTIRKKLDVIFICKAVNSFSLPTSFYDQYPDVIVIEGGEPFYCMKHDIWEL